MRGADYASSSFGGSLQGSVGGSMGSSMGASIGGSVGGSVTSSVDGEEDTRYVWGLSVRDKVPKVQRVLTVATSITLLSYAVYGLLF